MLKREYLSRSRLDVQQLFKDAERGPAKKGGKPFISFDHFFVRPTRTRTIHYQVNGRGDFPVLRGNDRIGCDLELIEPNE